MLKVMNNLEEEALILKEKTTGKKRKLLLENKTLIESNSFLSEDFFNILICLTSITRKIVQPGSMIDEEKIEKINVYKETIIMAITMLTEVLGMRETDITERKKLSEELKPVERFEFDVIPLLRFLEIQSKMNTIIEGYQEVGENITYEKTSEIATDLTKIENSIDNIATLLGNELKNNLIYKE